MAMELADFKTEATTLRNQDLTVRRLEERKKALEAQLAEKVRHVGLRIQGSGSSPCCSLLLRHGRLGAISSLPMRLSIQRAASAHSPADIATPFAHQLGGSPLLDTMQPVQQDKELEAAAARPAASDGLTPKEVAEREAALEQALGEARRGLDHMRRLHQAAQVC